MFFASILRMLTAQSIKNLGIITECYNNISYFHISNFSIAATKYKTIYHIFK